MKLCGIQRVGLITLATKIDEKNINKLVIKIAY